jgi:WD40 repeat protein
LQTREFRRDNVGGERVELWVRLGQGGARVFSLDSEPAGGPFTHEHQIRFARILPDGDTVVTARHDTTVRVWNRADAGKIREIAVGAQIRQADLSPDATLIATAGVNGTAAVWELATGNRVFQTQHTGRRSRASSSAATGGTSRWPEPRRRRCGTSSRPSR